MRSPLQPVCKPTEAHSLVSSPALQQVYDVSTAYGVAVDPYSGTLGPAVTDSYYLGPDQSNLVSHGS